MRHLRLPFIVLAVVLSGCAGGPTHDYYNPIVANGPKYKGPVTIALVDDVEAEKTKCLSDGYTLIGSTAYTGKYPEAVELKAQANRVHANHVIYSAKYVPPAPGSWHFNMGGWGAAGGSDGAATSSKIYFLGK